MFLDDDDHDVDDGHDDYDHDDDHDNELFCLN